jgi:hypothetical protein
MNTTSVWSPSEAREAIRSDLSRVRRGYSALVDLREEALLVQSIREDAVVDTFESFKAFARKLVEVRKLRGAS